MKGAIMGKINYIVRAEINNMPETAKNKDGYIVVRRDDNGKLWYYGSYNSQVVAQEIAVEIGNGLVLGVTQ